MIIHSGKLKNYLIEQIENYIIIISPKGLSYIIPVAAGIPVKCSCRGFTYGNNCKHYQHALTMELKDTEPIPTEKIGQWLSNVMDYAKQYKEITPVEINRELVGTKEEWYLDHKIPKP